MRTESDPGAKHSDRYQFQPGLDRKVGELMQKTTILMDTLNSKRETLGGLINDPAFYAKLNRIADNVQKLTASISEGRGVTRQTRH